MDNLVLVIYLVGVIKPLLLVVWVSVLVLLFISLMSGGCLSDAKGRRDEVKIKYWEEFGFKRYLISALLLTTLGVAIPTPSTAYTMLAAYAGVEVAQNEEVQELGGKGLEVLNKVIDDYLEKDSEN